MGTTTRKMLFGAALAAGLLAAGTAANAEPRGFYGHGVAERGFEGRGFARPYEHRDFVRPAIRGYYGGGVVVGGPVVDAYIPPCPGEGYEWIAGYYNGGVWIPGAWRFRERVGFNRGYGYREGFGEHRDFRADRGGFREERGGMDHGFHGRR